MALQFSVAVRNAQLDAIESTIGASARAIFYTGTAPANCAAAATGTVLADITCPADWLAAASGGAKALLGTWADTSANATGLVGYFRIWDPAVAVCGIQGSVTITGGGGDMTVDAVSFTAGQSFTITGFTLTAGNA